MQLRARVGTQADDIARVGRDLGFNQYNVEQVLLLQEWGGVRANTIMLTRAAPKRLNMAASACAVLTGCSGERQGSACRVYVCAG